MASKKKKLQPRTMARKATPKNGTSAKGMSPSGTSTKATASSAKGDESSREEFEKLCQEIVKETSVVARADRVKAAQAIYWRSKHTGKSGRGNAMVASFFPAISRLTGLSKRQVQYDLEIAKIHRSAKQLLVGKPLANRTLLLLALAKVKDWRQQVSLAKMSGNLRKFTKALSEIVPKEIKAKATTSPAIVPIHFGEPTEVLLGIRLYQVVLTRGDDGMSLTINPKVATPDATSEQGINASLADVKDTKDTKDTKDMDGVDNEVREVAATGKKNEDPPPVNAKDTKKAIIADVPEGVKDLPETPQASKVSAGTLLLASLKGPTTVPLSPVKVPVRTG